MKTKSILGLLLVCFSFPVIAQEIIKQETTTTTTTTTTSTSTNANIDANTNANTVANTVSVAETPTEKVAKWWVGPKFGLDINSMSITNVNVSKELTKNYQFGLLVQYGRTFYIQPEIYYSSYKITDEISKNYIKLPVQVGVKFLDLGLFSLHLTTGPSYSFKLDDTDQYTGETGFSWLVGAGVDVLGFITSDIRYTLRNKVTIADQISEFSSAYNTLNLTVGLKFR